MLKKILSIIMARWLITLVGSVALAWLVWSIGPLITVAGVRPLESPDIRFICGVVIVVAWGLTNIFRLVKAKKSNDNFIEEISVATTRDSADETISAGEIAQLKKNLQGALATLKSAKLGGKGRRRYLYQLPWYILIGPPGAGKTTALINSGLGFPFAERAAIESLRGVGGTRNCDWWFTNDAVFLDTAGRYTTQDSRQSVDRATWLGFLGLLRKYRPRQPINGIIVAVSITELMTTEPERMALARSIRQRINELHQEFGIHFPLYILFTKLDLLAGFQEFFDNFSQTERQQIWGATFPLPNKERLDSLATYEQEFDQLVSRLTERELERVHQEPDPQRRAMIFSFPSQLASLKPAAASFLSELFHQNQSNESPFFRGIYLTSSTQEGTPIDRIMTALASRFQIERRRLSAFVGPGRSYFLTSLLKDLIIQDANLLSANQNQKHRYLWLQRMTMAIAAVFFAVFFGIWLMSYQENREFLLTADKRVENYRSQTTGFTFTKIKDPELASILPALETLRNFPAGFADRNLKRPVPLRLTAGLDQRERIGSQAITTYQRALNLMMLPRLLIQLENQLFQNMQKSGFLSEGLKVYLMLGAQSRMDNSLVHKWMKRQWEYAYPGPDNARGRQALLEHLQALTTEPVKSIALNGALIDSVRRVTSGTAPAK